MCETPIQLPVITCSVSCWNNGVDKDDVARGTLKKLYDQLGRDQPMFQRNITDDESVVEAAPDELDGLPQDYIDHHKSGADGSIRINARDPMCRP